MCWPPLDTKSGCNQQVERRSSRYHHRARRWTTASTAHVYAHPAGADSLYRSHTLRAPWINGGSPTSFHYSLVIFPCTFVDEKKKKNGSMRLIRNESLNDVDYRPRTGSHFSEMQWSAPKLWGKRELRRELPGCYFYRQEIPQEISVPLCYRTTSLARYSYRK